MSAHYTWKPVALHLCLLLQQQGFTLDSADNGEEEIKTDNIDELVENLTACDEARLYVSRPFEFGGTRKLALYLVFGNEPHETVADYTVDEKLEAALEIFEEFWSRRRTPLAEAEASWVAEVRGLFSEHLLTSNSPKDIPYTPLDGPTPRTDAHLGMINRENNPLVETSRTLERELAEAREKLEYVASMGLRFGMMKSSDKPEPYLAHVWDENSDHERMFREWSKSIGLDARLKKITEQRDRLADILQEVINGRHGAYVRAKAAIAAVKGGQS